MNDQRASRYEGWLLKAAPVLVLGFGVALIVWGIATTNDTILNVGTGGTAFGTVALAFFTWSLATRTRDVVRSSQRLERLTLQQLDASREEAGAAGQAVLEAQRGRLDAVAPIVDFEVRVEAVQWCPSDTAGVEKWQELTDPRALDLDQVQLAAHIRLTVWNLGRTAGFVQFGQPCTPFIVAPGILRIDAERLNPQVLFALVHYERGDRAQETRVIEFTASATGPLTRTVRDDISWRGELKLMTDYGAGPLLTDQPPPVHITNFSVRRTHGLTEEDALHPALDKSKEALTLRSNASGA